MVVVGGGGNNALHSFIIVGSESAGRLAGISAAEGAAPCLSCHTDSPATAAALKGTAGGVGEGEAGDGGR